MTHVISRVVFLLFLKNNGFHICMFITGRILEASWSNLDGTEGQESAGEGAAQTQQKQQQ